MEKTYSIKEVSTMFDMPSSTLRYYEEQGLLTDVKKSASGLRIYEAKHLRRLSTLCCFKHAGMTISELKTFFDLDGDQRRNIDKILSLLEGRKGRLEEEIASLSKDLAHIERKLAFYRDIREAIRRKKPLPEWKDYREKAFLSKRKKST